MNFGAKIQFQYQGSNCDRYFDVILVFDKWSVALLLMTISKMWCVQSHSVLHWVIMMTLWCYQHLRTFMIQLFQYSSFPTWIKKSCMRDGLNDQHNISWRSNLVVQPGYDISFFLSINTFGCDPGEGISTLHPKLSNCFPTKWSFLRTATIWYKCLYHREWPGALCWQGEICAMAEALYHSQSKCVHNHTWLELYYWNGKALWACIPYLHSQRHWGP